MTHPAGSPATGPIGVFDSGFGGLSVLRSLRSRLPQYSFLYLGDNARAPYGTRSFDAVHAFTRQAVEYLFNHGCPLVILACNTASAKALRSIQQKWLPASADPSRRVLGVIRPSVEAVGGITRNGHVGILATPGTVASRSYDMELSKMYGPRVRVSAHACPMWVALVEYGYADSPGADFFVKQDVDRLLEADPQIDTVLLACTHYPLLYNKIRDALPSGISLVPQGDITAASLEDYLLRHPEMDSRLARGGSVDYLTTDHSEKFETTAAIFMGAPVTASTVTLN